MLLFLGEVILTTPSQTRLPHASYRFPCCGLGSGFAVASAAAFSLVRMSLILEVQTPGYRPQMKTSKQDFKESQLRNSTGNCKEK